MYRVNLHNFVNGFSLIGSMLREWCELMTHKNYGDVVMSKYWLEVWGNPIQQTPCWVDFSFNLSSEGVCLLFQVYSLLFGRSSNTAQQKRRRRG